jgi:aminocarboxymuconate-semialdehyde decarboxylase
MKGAEIGPHVEGVPLDSPEMSRVLAVAADLDVAIVVHPYYVGTDPVLSDFYLTNLLGNPWQTTICASRLIVSGALDRMRGLRILLVHGGGYLTAALGRLDHGYRVRPELGHMTAKPSAFARRFYYDSLTHDAVGLRRLIESVGEDRVLFGSDVPFDMGAASFTEQVGADPLDQRALESVAHKNAEALFGLREVSARA